MTAFASHGWTPPARGGMPSALAVTLVHGLLIVALMQLGRIPLPTLAPTVFATLISETVAAPVPTVRKPPAPKALAPQIVNTPLQLAALPLVTFTENSTHQTAAPVPPAPTVAPQEAVTITPVRFDADYLHNPAPAYPSLSRRAQEQGRVVLRVLVDALGDAQEVNLHTSSGFPRLDQAALVTVKRWKFQPARRGDTPVAATVLVPIDFSLTG